MVVDFVIDKSAGQIKLHMPHDLKTLAMSTIASQTIISYLKSEVNDINIHSIS